MAAWRPSWCTACDGTLSPAGLAYGVGSAAAWALGTVAFKRAAPRSILWFIALPFLLGGLLIVASGLAFGERWADIAWTPTFVLVLAYGAAVGLALSWTLWLALVAAGEASRMAGNTFLVPLVSVAAGTLFLGEPLTAMLAVGGAAVIGGVYLVNRPASGRLNTAGRVDWMARSVPYASCAVHRTAHQDRSLHHGQCRARISPNGAPASAFQRDPAGT